MEQILGLDLGTNSIGWAVVERENKEFRLVKKGVRIFQEGVKIEKGIESSKAAERTEHRSSRRLKFRRKLRKIETLKVLSEHGFCPRLTLEQLIDWRYKKIYPANIAFRDWLRTDINTSKDERQRQIRNPYYYRNLAVTCKLNLNSEEDRYKIGRAFYHIAQRRGFISNRLEGTKESDGAVKESISELNVAKGDKTLGQYFYSNYCNNEKIRNVYTHREEHYLQEFNTICEYQNIPGEIKEKLYKAIFYQRPLKSQKGLIGKCVFEADKQRCSASHPKFEEYRMLCFINNIKIKTPNDDKLRFLNEDERGKIKPLFFRKSKEVFDFEDIAKAVSPKKRYKFFKSPNTEPGDFLFNFSMKTAVSGNPVSSRLKELFGDSFMDVEFEYTREKDGKQSVIDINDIWHVVYTFDSSDKLKEFGGKRLGLNDEQAESFVKIHPKREYSSLSLKAINKILPYLREGLIYSHAVFLANMEQIIPDFVWNDPQNKKIISEGIKRIIETQNEEKIIIDVINGLIKNARYKSYVWSDEAKGIYKKDLFGEIRSQLGEKKYSSFSVAEKQYIEKNSLGLFEEQMNKNMGRGEFLQSKRIEDRVKSFLSDNFDIDDSRLQLLYHPSAIEVYKPPYRAEDGKYYLGSPMITSVRNPMAMRSLHQLRKLINELIRNEIIDKDTKINIEMARNLMNSNERKAYQEWQRDRENLRKTYYNRIKEYYAYSGSNAEPSQDDILKYQLWEEQNHKCIYTGKEIAVSQFLGANPSYDIEHTIPRSQSFDNSQVNKTLCNNVFNRDIKKNKIPFELKNHEEILARVEHWKNKYEDLEKQIQNTVKQARGNIDKQKKDRIIQKRHRLRFERYYYYNKYRRFVMEDVPEGFKNSQIVDTGIITKYARLYLKTLFSNVYTVKGNTVADFRVLWGLNKEYIKKERVNHIHHCIDAVTIACITKESYENLAKFYHEWEYLEKAGMERKPKVNKPWSTFVEDIKDLEKEVLVSHYTPDVFPKQTKKKLRKKSIVKKNKDGVPIYQRGDTVRGSLHQETFYGAIEQEIQNKEGEKEKQIKYVVRKPLDDLDNNGIEKIVDDRVRNIIINARKKEKELRVDLEDLRKQMNNAEEYEERDIQREIEKIENDIKKLYCLPNKNGNPVPIRKVRVYTPMLTNPIHLKEHRDKSMKRRYPHKEQYHVANDGNYMIAIYEGKNEKGKTKRDFEIVNNLEAGEYFKLSVQREFKPKGVGKYEGLISALKENEDIQMPLKGILKIGTMIILWEDNPEEVWEIEQEEISKRLYKVIGLSNQRIKSKAGKINEYATIVLRFHQESRPSSELKVQDGVFVRNEDYKAQRKLNHNQFNALIEGLNFEISTLGEIKRMD